jgi:1,4-dihydroxy-2-naphthoate octaprenyltransferase
MAMKKWIQAMRLRTLPLAASCILTGAAAAKSDGHSNTQILTLTLITTFLLQILSNLANDYGDFSHGVDNESRVGPARAMQSGLISQMQMKRALIVTTLLTLISGISMLWIVFSPLSQFLTALLMLILGIAAIASAIKYTVGKSPYGYRGLGDLFVFVFFGPVGVVGTYFLLSNHMALHTLLLASTIGLFSTAVLNLNNLRDHENDRSMGKNTLVVMMGFRNGKMYQTFLIGTGTILLLLWVILFSNNYYSALALLPATMQSVLLAKVWRTHTPAALDSELKKVALLTFAVSVILFLV